MRLGTRSLVAAAAVGLLVAQLGRIPGTAIGGRGAALTLLDLTLIPLWLLLALTLISGRRRWPLDQVSRWALLFVVVAIASLGAAIPKWGLGGGELFGAAAFLLRWILYAGWFVLLVSDPEPEAAAGDAWRLFERVLIAVAAFGILQSAFLPNFAMQASGWTGLEWDMQGRRLVSTIFDPNHAGALIAMVLLMRLARENEGLRDHRGVLLLLTTALILTLSRSAVLGLLAGIAVLVIARGVRPSLRRVAIGGAILLAPAIPAVIWFADRFNKLQVDASALQRLVPWLRGWIMVRDYPVLGVGFNAAGPAQRAYGWETLGGAEISMDGGLLFIAVLTGLLGLTAYLGMLGAVGVAARRTWRSAEQTAERRAFAVGAWAATISVVVASLFGNLLLMPLLMLPLWVLWARVTAMAR